MNRRKFIESSGRSISAALLGLLTGYLVLERKISAPAACGENAFCRNCLKFSACEKPQALHYQSSSQPSGTEAKNQNNGKE